MKIHKKLTLGFFGTSSLVGVIGCLAILVNAKLYDNITQVNKIYVEQAKIAANLALSLEKININSHKLIIKQLKNSLTLKSIKEIKENIENIEKILITARSITELEYKAETINSKFKHNKNHLVIIQKIEENFLIYKKLILDYITLASSTNEQAEDFLINTLEIYSNNKLIPLIEEYDKTAINELANNAEQTKLFIIKFNLVIVIFTFIGLLSAIILNYLVSRSIAQPIIKLKDAALKVGEGHLDTHVDIHSKDEVGILANAFNQMIEGLGKTTVSKFYLDKILGSMSDSLIVIDLDKKITKINQATLDILEYTDQELIGQPIYILFAENAEFKINKLVDQGFIGNIDINFLTKNGNNIPMSFSSSLINDEYDERQGFVCVARDISQQRQAEMAMLRVKVAEAAREEVNNALQKEKQLNELKSRFVSMASHEFRTPLATILSSTELLQDYDLQWTSEKKAKHFQRISSSVKHMTDLLNDVLLIGQAEAGKIEFKPTELDLAQFCRELVEEIELTTKTHAITFVSQGNYISAWMDEKLLRHIFSNLLSNAIKYSPEGGIVNFELFCQEKQAIFRIQDQGIGIPAADQARLFDSFHRASNVGTISGTGLGLSIVKKYVELHGGQIIVASAVGFGTTFQVTLPLQKGLGVRG